MVKMLFKKSFISQDILLIIIAKFRPSFSSMIGAVPHEADKRHRGSDPGKVTVVVRLS
jgi:hypothetical protein